MEYIDTHKCITKPFVFTLLVIPFSCRNITVFGYRQGFNKIISLQFCLHGKFHLGVR